MLMMMLAARTYFLPLNDQRQIESPNSIISCPVTSQESGHLWDVWSPTEALRAVILGQKPKDGKGEEQFFLQIWNSQQLVKSINLSEKDKHGKVSIQAIMSHKDNFFSVGLAGKAAGSKRDGKK